MDLKAKIILMAAIFLLPLSVLAQPAKIKYRDRLGDSTTLVNTAEKPPKVKGPKPLRGELSGGVRISTDGYGIFVDKGWLKRNEGMGRQQADRFFNVRLLQIEISERKHPKETTSGAFTGSSFQSSSYILGKINNFYMIKVGYGQRRLIAGKPDPGTVSVHLVYLGGFSAALLKPYYLNLANLGEVKYSDDIAQYFITPGYILNKSGIAKGFNEISFVPGVYLRTGLHFDFATKRKGLIALETGVTGEYYSRKIEQMVLQDPKQFFLGFYASLQLGKRW